MVATLLHSRMLLLVYIYTHRQILYLILFYSDIAHQLAPLFINVVKIIANITHRYGLLNIIRIHMGYIIYLQCIEGHINAVI